MSLIFNPFDGHLQFKGGGSSTSPGGSDTDIQFNNAGSFGGNSNMTMDSSGNITFCGNINDPQWRWPDLFEWWKYKFPQ